MVETTTFFEKFLDLQEKDRNEDQLIEILHLYMDVFPVENAYFFSYSPMTFIAEGIFSINQSTGIQICNEIRDDIRTLPPIYSAILERKAKYLNGNDFYKNSSLKYIMESKVNAILVTPIYIGHVVIGYLCSTKIKQKTNVNERILDSLTKFGSLIGQLFNSNKNINADTILSKREIETMRRISWGETTKIIAANMNISEYTVNQYVKSAIKKLEANNRTHAVAILLRKGII